MSAPLDASFEPGPAEQAIADADCAWHFALGLGDHASPGRTAAVMSLLLDHVAADAVRLSAAAVVCRSRHGPGEDDGYPQAEQLLHLAQQRVAAAGADNDAAGRERLLGDIHAQWHPEPQPFEWNRRRRRRPRWWLRYLSTRFTRLRHEPALAPAGVRRMYLDLGRRQVGRMLYQVCDECRLALVGKVDITNDYQGLELGTKMILYAYARHPDHAWHTTPQYLTSGTFWPRTARRTGAAFTEASQCEHMNRDLPKG